MNSGDLETRPFLIFSRQTELGEAINTLLRNHGILSEIRYVESAKGLAEETPLDWSLLLWDPEADLSWPKLPAELRERWNEVPRITLFAKTPSAPPEGVWISLDDPDRTRQTLEREHRLSRLARERGRLLFEIDEVNRNTRLVFGALETAVAFIQDGLYLYANRAYLASFGLETYEGGSFLEAFQAQDRGRVKQVLKTVLHSAEQETRELEAIPQGQDRAVRLALRATTFGSEPAIFIMRHPDARTVAAQPSAQVPAPTAPPTLPGILEPADFLVHLEELLQASRPKRSEQAVLIACIDNLSALIEQYGPFTIHAAWTLVERKVIPNLAPTDFCTRLGWELCFWIERPRNGSLEKWAQDIQTSVSNQIYEVLGKSILLGIKVGISERISRSNTRSLVREAQLAASGTQPVNWYQPSTLSADQSDDIASALARMNERKTLPIVTRQILSLIGGDSRPRFELRLSQNLLRTYRLNSWEEFFRLAHESDSLAGLETLLIETAIGFLSRPETPKGCAIYLRLSGLVLMTPETQAWLARILTQKFGGKLVFLFQEKTVAEQLKKTQEWIARFKPAGIQIGLDGFGESAHSAILLNHVRPDLVRIPVTHLVSPEDPDAAETDAPPAPPEQTRILAPLKAHGIEILATGVDRARLMTSLLNLGITFVQGPFVGEDTPLT
ncbi:Diguanylate phosphodiesterase, predicted domain protein [mine drainage metagenome]|uniref:Diguanylate phosphodiesterase, predicted domain protein n=1 Tax=mine drainage metagenome TaxID=410659 RepID=T0ZZR4_9ZZZZ